MTDGPTRAIRTASVVDLDSPTADRSLGELVAEATRELSELFRQELQLARVEITRDVTAAGKGAGLLGGAGVVALFGVQFLSVAIALGLAALGLTLGWAFLVVAVVYLAVAGALAAQGRLTLSRVSPPRETLRTVRDDLEWAKHPTRPTP